jgi:formate/nitrite transporter
MEKRFLTPVEVAEATISSGVKKAKLTSLHMVLLGILAGMFIAFGGFGNILVTQTLSNLDVGVAKLLGGAVFPIGLMLVVVCGAELFTGNNLMTLALLDKKISFSQMMKNWTLVYLANFIGSMIIVLLVYYGDMLTGTAAQKAIAVAKSKVELGTSVAFLRGIMCNIIVVLAVWMATASQDIVSKIFACWFPIMLFVLSGFEHSVANMFFLPIAMYMGADISWYQAWSNILPVTIGNIVGGGIIVPLIYYVCYIFPNRQPKAKEKLAEVLRK